MNREEEECTMDPSPELELQALRNEVERLRAQVADKTRVTIRPKEPELFHGNQDENVRRWLVRWFVAGFAELANPLTQLTSPQQPYVWMDSQQRAFDALKRELTSTSFLQLPDYDLPFVIHTDASDVAIGAVLAQDHGEGLRPISYYWKV